MIRQIRNRQAIVGFTAIVVLLGMKSIRAEEPQELRIIVAAAIDSALIAAKESDDPQRRIAELESAGEAALRSYSANVFVNEIVAEVQQSDASPPKRAKQWRAALVEARDLLRFQPFSEAPLPKGFPEPTPVGEIRLQSYPAYRLARTDMKRVGGRAFWTLFQHIKQREIAMTAPVQMTYAANVENELEKVEMAFLYRRPDQGRLETAGNVDVVDVPAQLAISIGLRGDATPERVTDAKPHLESWLRDHGDEYESTGPLRVMGHNSPFVLDRKRLTEVQIPVRSKHDAASTVP